MIFHVLVVQFGMKHFLTSLEWLIPRIFFLNKKNQFLYRYLTFYNIINQINKIFNIMFMATFFQIFWWNVDWVEFSQTYLRAGITSTDYSLESYVINILIASFVILSNLKSQMVCMMEIILEFKNWQDSNIIDKRGL